MIWLRNGIAGDDTHGHVDDLARFVSPDTVVLASEADRADPNYEPLRENAAILRAAGLRVVKLPMPRPLLFTGQRLPASYANFYIANGLVLVPTFNDPNDRIALNTLARLFPGSRSHRHQLHGADLGTGRAPLHDAAAAGAVTGWARPPHQASKKSSGSTPACFNIARSVPSGISPG